MRDCVEKIQWRMSGKYYDEPMKLNFVKYGTFDSTLVECTLTLTNTLKVWWKIRIKALSLCDSISCS